MLKKAVCFIAQPGIPYPYSAALHAIVGACIGCLPPQLFDMTITPGHAGEIGAVVGVVVGFGCWLTGKALS